MGPQNGHSNWKPLLFTRYRTAFERKLIMRNIIACADVKVRFGSLNYNDRLTALNVISFEIDKTVNLHLLNK